MLRKACAFLSCAVLLAACNPQPQRGAGTATPQPTASPSASGLPPIDISGKGTAKQPVRIYYAKGNRKQYELQALSSYANAGARGTRAVFATTTLHFYGKDGSTMTAQAPRATVDETANTVTLTGGVHATTSAGEDLHCDTLVYDRRTEMIHGQGNVIATDRNGLHATANTIDSDVSLTNARMQ